MIDWTEYVSLKQAARDTGTPYTTLHTWAIMGLLPGAIARNGTRWYVHKLTLERIANGEIQVKGSFRKTD